MNKEFLIKTKKFEKFFNETKKEVNRQLQKVDDSKDTRLSYYGRALQSAIACDNDYLNEQMSLIAAKKSNLSAINRQAILDLFSKAQVKMAIANEKARKLREERAKQAQIAENQKKT
ncbi:MAG: hypothetical protein LBS50_03005 [Prevotellaceae bacterium]|nr:hypothetical protein [Prevotellaceae bacterium]